MNSTKISIEDEERLDKLYKDAIGLEKKGNTQAAIDKLSEMLGYQPKYDVLAFVIMGDIYWDTNELHKAVECFEKSVRINPKSEKASLGLFHTLWESGREDEAFNEMRRFLSISKSKEYSSILNAMKKPLERKKNKP